MELEIASLVLILLVLVFLATIDTAFARMSDVSLRRLATDAEDAEKNSSAELLRKILEDRPRFRLLLSSAIQILLIGFTVVLTLFIKIFVDEDLKLLACVSGFRSRTDGTITTSSAATYCEYKYRKQTVVYFAGCPSAVLFCQSSHAGRSAADY